MKTKISDFYCACLCENYDVVVLTETWLSSEIFSEDIFDDRYTVFRTDRNVNNSAKKIGGGVLIAVNKCYKSLLIQLDCNTVEQIFVKVSTGLQDIVFGSVYLPPDSNIEKYSSHVNSVMSVCDNFVDCDVVIVGDYNLPNIKWNADYGGTDLVALDSMGNREGCISDGLSSCFLKQYNYLKNFHGNVLDLCFSNCNTIELSSCDPLLKIDPSHPPFIVECDIICDNNVDSESVIYYYDFNAASYSDLSNYLSNVDWTNILSNNDVDEAVKIFYDHIYKARDYFVPVKRKIISKYPPWFDSEIINLIGAKKSAHRAYKLTKNLSEYKTFSDLRKLCKIYIRHAYDNYLNNVEADLITNPENFWKYVRKKSNHNNLIPLPISHDEKICDNYKDACDIFNEYFTSVYSVESGSNFDVMYDVDINVHNISVDACDVLKNLVNLNCKKGAGPDGIPPKFYKELSSDLALPFCIIFNLSIQSGKFPQAWKSAYVVPVHKSGNRCCVENYRPVSILSSPTKVFESIISNYIFAKFQSIITSDQHGFYRKRSTITNLLCYVNDIIDVMKGGFEVHAVYTDFSKAFDKVVHDILIKKLSAYGVSGCLLQWFVSYLSDRTQQVKLANNLSAARHVSSGVPQGSILGPLLFSIFINDVNREFLCNSCIFADDLKVYKVIKSSDDVDDLQKDLTTLSTWCQDNKMQLNFEKCTVISFSRKLKSTNPYYLLDNKVVKVASVVRDLGVFLDNKLSFVSHCEHVVSKANRALGCLRRYGREFRNIRTLTLLFTTFVRSILEYGCVIWAPYYNAHIDRIEAVQTKYTKFVLGKLPLRIRHSIELCKSYLGLANLHQRTKFFKICFMYKVLNNMYDMCLIYNYLTFNVPKYAVRKVPLFYLTHCETNYALQSPINSIMAACNLVSNDVDFFHGNFIKFKHLVRMSLSI